MGVTVMADRSDDEQSGEVRPALRWSKPTKKRSVTVTPSPREGQTQIWVY